MKFPKHLRIEVTADDIALGQRSNTAHCPIARAVRRIAGPKVGYVMVDGAYAEFSVTNDVTHDFSYRLNNRAAQFVDSFDHDRPVKPLVTIATRA